MSFKKDRKYDQKIKSQKRLFRLVKNKAKEKINHKLSDLINDKIYKLSDLGFKSDLELTGKQIKSGFE